MGPRLTADVLPLWAVLAAAGVETLLATRWLSWLPIAAVVASVAIAAGHAFSDTWVWESTPVYVTIAETDRLFDWRDPEVLYPFWRTPYEERFPIGLRGPPPKASVTDETVSFAWEPAPTAGAHYLVELVLKYGPSEALWRKTYLSADLATSLSITPADLAAGRCVSSPVMWRVVAEDDSGRQIARSGWRWLIWQPPPREGPLLRQDDFETGDLVRWRTRQGGAVDHHGQ
jgi:hypothetical protein